MNEPSIVLDGVCFSYRAPIGAGDGQGDVAHPPAHTEAKAPSDAHRTTPGATGPVIAALTDISFTCDPGTITLICGASGSGKSTVLRVINGLIPHFNEGELTGTVRVKGTSIPDAPIEDLGQESETVFQNPRSQFFTSEVLSELAFREENWGEDPQVILEKVQAAAQAVGIEDLLDARLDQLSGGQLQKVACAQALAPGTTVLLFDEPTSNLSPEAIDGFAKLLGQLKAQGHTIVVAEHRLYCLNGLADQVIIMADGRITHQLHGDAFYAVDDQTRRDLGLRTLHDPRFEPGPARPQPGEGLGIEQLRFAYARHPVLRIDHVVFSAGKITALTGENGVGKSTLARIICGLTKAEKGGTITLNGQPLSSAKRLASTALVMQDVHRQLFADSVLGEVMIGRDGEQDETNAKQVLEELGLGTTLDRHPLALSGGQKQRLVVASAVVAHKAIYLFDEPTSGVDYRHLQGISNQMRRLADQGAVVIVITHDPELIATCADDIAVMHQASQVGPNQSQLRLYSSRH